MKFDNENYLYWSRFFPHVEDEECLFLRGDEQFFDSKLCRFYPNGPYWILKRGASGWVPLDRFIEEGDE